MSDNKFEIKVSVSKIPKEGRGTRSWALSELARQTGDCLFNETECVQEGNTLTYTFKGEKTPVKYLGGPEGTPVPKTEKRRKPAKKKQTLAERLGVKS